MRACSALSEDCPKPMPDSSAACYSTQLCAWVGALATLHAIFGWQKEARSREEPRILAQRVLYALLHVVAIFY